MISKFRNAALVAMLIVAGIFSLNAQSTQMWKLDKAHTSVDFSINHFFSPVTGNFTDFDGTFYFDKNDLENSKMTFAVKLKSIDTNNKKRDKHLLSKDFFDAKKYPEIQFTSVKIEKKNAQEYMVHGRLKIKNKTKDVVLPMKITGEMEHPMMKGTHILGVVIDTVIHRTDFGVGTGNWATTMVVGDDVKIHIPVELNRK